MADDPMTIELSRSELRAVTGFAAECARPALEIFALARPEPVVWVSYLPLLPLAVLVASGMYMFVRSPRRGAKRGVDSPAPSGAVELGRLT